MNKPLLSAYLLVAIAPTAFAGNPFVAETDPCKEQLNPFAMRNPALKSCQKTKLDAFQKIRKTHSKEHPEIVSQCEKQSERGDWIAVLDCVEKQIPANDRP